MSAKEKVNRVKVKIHHDEYTIKGNAAPRHIERVAAFVDEKMRQIEMRNPHLPLSKVAVLSAVNITDELFRLREDYEALIKLLDEDKNN